MVTCFLSALDRYQISRGYWNWNLMRIQYSLNHVRFHLAMKHMIEKELDRLEDLEVIQKVTYSNWGTPIVPVIKSDTTLRLCADYKFTVYKQLCNDNYPIPRIDEFFSKLTGAKHFCTLDIHQAYLHLTMDKESSMIQSISTHKVYSLLTRWFGYNLV
jgi:hypothetical protein